MGREKSLSDSKNYQGYQSAGSHHLEQARSFHFEVPQQNIPLQASRASSSGVSQDACSKDTNDGRGCRTLTVLHIALCKLSRNNII